MREPSWRVLRWVVPYLLLVAFGGLASGVVWLELSRVPTTEGLSLRHPQALWLGFVAIPVLWLGVHRGSRRVGTMRFSRVAELAALRPGLFSLTSSTPRILRLVALGLLLLAAARPQSYMREVRDVEGIDIMLVVDVSESMRTADLDGTRLQAAQETIRKFLRTREEAARLEGEKDRIGLIVFAREAMLECPLTLDYYTLAASVDGLAVGDVESRGTAVGDALGLAIATMRRAREPSSRAVVLLTDGDSNAANMMAPAEARQLAQDREIRVFTVLVGRQDGGSGAGENLDAGLLEQIARDTGGAFFRAQDAQALQQGFGAVRDSLEKSKHKEVYTTYRELFPALVVLALLFLGLELFLSLTRYRRFP